MNQLGILLKGKIMKLLITTQSYSYFKRQWWQLSSLINQVPALSGSVPDITYRINVYEKDPHIDMAHRMVDVFSPFIKIDLITWTEQNQFAYRGFVRNKDIQECWDYDSILFLDPDIVIHPELTSRFSYYADTEYLVTVGRHMVQNADELIDKEDYKNPILNYSEKIGDFELSPFPSRRGAGFFQFANVKVMKDKNINFYARSIKDRSIFDPIHFGTLSEQRFRSKFEKVIFGDKLARIWHLEHERFKTFDLK